MGFVKARNHQSDLGHAICDNPDFDCDIAVIANDVSVSMRSRNSCPVSLADVAKHNGGGGHDHAAGVGFRELLGFGLVEQVMEKLDFNI